MHGQNNINVYAICYIQLWHILRGLLSEVHQARTLSGHTFLKYYLSTMKQISIEIILYLHRVSLLDNITVYFVFRAKLYKDVVLKNGSKKCGHRL